MPRTVYRKDYAPISQAAFLQEYLAARQAHNSRRANHQKHAPFCWELSASSGEEDNGYGEQVKRMEDAHDYGRKSGGGSREKVQSAGGGGSSMAASSGGGAVGGGEGKRGTPLAPAHAPKRKGDCDDIAVGFEESPAQSASSSCGDGPGPREKQREPYLQHHHQQHEDAGGKRERSAKNVGGNGGKEALDSRAGTGGDSGEKRMGILKSSGGDKATGYQAAVAPALAADGSARGGPVGAVGDGRPAHQPHHPPAPPAHAAPPSVRPVIPVLDQLAPKARPPAALPPAAVSAPHARADASHSALPARPSHPSQPPPPQPPSHNSKAPAQPNAHPPQSNVREPQHAVVAKPQQRKGLRSERKQPFALYGHGSARNDVYERPRTFNIRASHEVHPHALDTAILRGLVSTAKAKHLVSTPGKEFLPPTREELAWREQGHHLHYHAYGHVYVDPQTREGLDRRPVGGVSGDGASAGYHHGGVGSGGIRGVKSSVDGGGGTGVLRDGGAEEQQRKGAWIAAGSSGDGVLSDVVMAKETEKGQALQKQGHGAAAGPGQGAAEAGKYNEGVRKGEAPVMMERAAESDARRHKEAENDGNDSDTVSDSNTYRVEHPLQPTRPPTLAALVQGQGELNIDAIRQSLREQRSEHERKTLMELEAQRQARLVKSQRSWCTTTYRDSFRAPNQDKKT